MADVAEYFEVVGVLNVPIGVVEEASCNVLSVRFIGGDPVGQDCCRREAWLKLLAFKPCEHQAERDRAKTERRPTGITQEAP